MRRRLLLANSHAASGGGDFPHNLVLTHGQQDDVSLAFYDWAKEMYDSIYPDGSIGEVSIEKYNITLVFGDGANYNPISFNMKNGYVGFTVEGIANYSATLGYNGACYFDFRD